MCSAVPTGPVEGEPVSIPPAAAPRQKGGASAPPSSTQRRVRQRPNTATSADGWRRPAPPSPVEPPATTAIYCLPLTLYVIGGAVIGVPRLKLHSSLSVVSS